MLGLNQSLRGAAVVLAAHRAQRVGDADETVVDDGFGQAVHELMGAGGETVGFDMSMLSPYLSALSTGFGGGGDKKDDDAKIKAAAAELQRQEAERKASSSKTTLYVVLGLLGALVLGGGAFMVARKK